MAPAMSASAAARDALVERARARRGRVDDLQSESGPALGKRDSDGCQRRRSTMLDVLYDPEGAH
jgi:hypothetical protein